MNNDVTIITAFLDIGRDSWEGYKRNVDQYLKAFSVYLKYDYKMIIYIDDRYYKDVFDMVDFSEHKNNKIVIPINESWMEKNIWSWTRLERETEIMNSDSYKSLVADRIRLNYPENTNPKYTILTHSKIDFVNHAIESNFLDSKYFAWSDFGYFHDKTSFEFLPNSTLDVNKFDLDRVNLCLINPIDDNDKDEIWTLKNAPEKIGAYFFFGTKEKLDIFQNLCHRFLIEYQERGIADDEQGLWLKCYFHDPDLFKLHVFGSWHRALKAFSL